jgi:hypothetical protein
MVTGEDEGAIPDLEEISEIRAAMESPAEDQLVQELGATEGDAGAFAFPEEPGEASVDQALAPYSRASQEVVDSAGTVPESPGFINDNDSSLENLLRPPP